MLNMHSILLEMLKVVFFTSAFLWANYIGNKIIRTELN